MQECSLKQIKKDCRCNLNQLKSLIKKYIDDLLLNFLNYSFNPKFLLIKMNHHKTRDKCMIFMIIFFLLINICTTIILLVKF